jgi:hypothetical protein
MGLSFELMYLAGLSLFFVAPSPRRPRGIGERAPAEGDDAPLRVDDREHQAVAEAVVVPLPLERGDEEPDALGRDRRDPLLAEEVGEPVPLGGA